MFHIEHAGVELVKILCMHYLKTGAFVMSGLGDFVVGSSPPSKRRDTSQSLVNEE